MGSADPNPLVSGKGIAALRVQGVAVTEGVLREECDALNRIFFHFITTKRPFVSMKYAMTMDGKIATVTGASKWITSEAILATCCADPKRQAIYRQAGCRVICLDKRNGHIDLVQLMEKLGQEQLDSILLEGGGTLNWAALESGVVQQVQAYIAPKLFGGQEAKTPVEGAGVPVPSAAFRLKNSSLTQLGEDILIESEVEYPCSLEL